MTIPTEPIGSIPRPPELLAGLAEKGAFDPELEPLYRRAVRDTIERFEATGSPVITDGEQRKFHNFWTYSVQALANTAPDGFRIPFEAGHTRHMLRLTSGPFRYARYADAYLEEARSLAHRPVKQAVISASALSLMYPAEGLPDYPREQFLEDLVRECETEIRRCLAAGAHCVQLDFTEGRLAVRLDPTGGLLRSFVGLNNLVLSRFSEKDRKRLGVHTCPGSDLDSTHSANVDYASSLARLFDLQVDNFYVALARESDRQRVLRLIAEHLGPGQRVFVGVIDPTNPRIETAEEVRERTLEAARMLPPDRFGTTDDCGFSPFSDDTTTSRDVAFAKIRARVEGTALASRELEGS